MSVNLLQHTPTPLALCTELGHPRRTYSPLHGCEGTDSLIAVMYWHRVVPQNEERMPMSITAIVSTIKNVQSKLT